MAVEVNGYSAPSGHGHGHGHVLNSPSRLRKIDQLREKGIGQYLPLPQLVAVGDQSSGKSSLLESLTGIPFPRAQELCTRYATQITHRREELSYITISIIPGPLATREDSIKLTSYSRVVQSTAELHTQFPEILDEVNVQMGIRTSNNPNGDKTFTENVLKIEKCGPEEDYLTVIDVPGIFRTTDEGKTTERDKVLVMDMVKRYIRDDRTIILAVLPSVVDVATQEILSLAEAYDKDGERTLGVLTKPDLVKDDSAKLAVCRLVEGKRKALNLGYYIVRNRGDEDLSLQEREGLFQEQPWCRLPSDRLGVVALRERLQELLGQITDRAFPKLRAETSKMLAGARKEFEGLGPPRQTEREQQLYLAGLAGKFQAMVRAALDADYSAHEAFTNDDLRLITKVVNISEGFSQRFEMSAHTYSFAIGRSSQVKYSVDASPVEEKVVEVAGSSDGSSGNYVRYLEASCPEKLDIQEFPDLEQIVDTNSDDESPAAGIMDWIESMDHRSKGIWLGTIGPHLLSSAFREQSERWGSMTRHYLSAIIWAIHKFISGALEIVCLDSRVRKELMSTIMSELLVKYGEGMKQAMFLVDVEREKKPYTLNHYFNNNLQKARCHRLEKTLKGKMKENSDPWTHQATYVISLDSIRSAVSDKSNDEHKKEEIYDILLAYYKVARKRFVDNVYYQAVDHCLLSGPESPLLLFSEQWVLGLDSEKLDAVAGESFSTRNRRERLRKKIADLEEAMKILR